MYIDLKILYDLIEIEIEIIKNYNHFQIKLKLNRNYKRIKSILI